MWRTAEIIGTWELRGEAIVVGAWRLGICAASPYLLYILYIHTNAHICIHLHLHTYTLQWRGRQMTFCGAPARLTGARPNFKKNPAKVNYEWRPHGNDIITRRPSSPFVRHWHACTPLPPHRVVYIILHVYNMYHYYSVIIASGLLSGPIYRGFVGGREKETRSTWITKKKKWIQTPCGAA
jgi:hypothetical protein